MADALDPIRLTLRRLFEEEQEIRARAGDLDRRILDMAADDPLLPNLKKRRANAQQELRENEQLTTDYLRNAILDAPHHAFDGSALGSFREDFAREDLVFVMTKFPDSGNPDAPALGRVIEAVQGALRAQKREPRIATWPYEDLVWRNVGLHMIGCGRGIAIVEDKYRKELNPNVAIEWGYMLGSGREVRFLKERSFGHLRADFLGRTYEEFDWADPEPGIREAVKKWYPLR